MKQHVVGDHRRHPGPRGQQGQPMQAQRIVGPPPQGQRQIGAIAEDLAHPAQAQRTVVIGHVGDQDRQKALGVVRHIGPVQVARPLARPRLAQGQQTAQSAIARAVHRIDQHRHAAAQVQAAADDQPHAGVVGRLERADDARQAVAVRDGQRPHAHQRRGGEQLLRGGRPAQEREMRGHLQFDIAHPKTPCRNQLWDPVVTSSPSPWRKIQNRRPAWSSMRK